MTIPFAPFVALLFSSSAAAIGFWWLTFKWERLSNEWAKEAKASQRKIWAIQNHHLLTCTGDCTLCGVIECPANEPTHVCNECASCDAQEGTP